MSNRVSPEPNITHTSDQTKDSSPEREVKATKENVSSTDYLGVVREGDSRTPDGEPDVQVSHAVRHRTPAEDKTTLQQLLHDTGASEDKMSTPRANTSNSKTESFVIGAHNLECHEKSSLT
ncbi:hypothetical protein Btru_076445 [Bulinus truncatus]|nr:hypothetical protein Btru_076445 [Bulinus truncatus]